VPVRWWFLLAFGAVLLASSKARLNLRSRVLLSGAVQGCVKMLRIFFLPRLRPAFVGCRCECCCLAVPCAKREAIANSMAEMFTMQRYLQADDLKKHNLHHFDSWAATIRE